MDMSAGSTHGELHCTTSEATQMLQRQSQNHKYSVPPAADNTKVRPMSQCRVFIEYLQMPMMTPPKQKR